MVRSHERLLLSEQYYFYYIEVGSDFCYLKASHPLPYLIAYSILVYIHLNASILLNPEVMTCYLNKSNMTHYIGISYKPTYCYTIGK